jgi:hypothetical protein
MHFISIIEGVLGDTECNFRDHDSPPVRAAAVPLRPPTAALTLT